DRGSAAEEDPDEQNQARAETGRAWCDEAVERHEQRARQTGDGGGDRESKELCRVGRDAQRGRGVVGLAEGQEASPGAGANEVSDEQKRQTGQRQRQVVEAASAEVVAEELGLRYTEQARIGARQAPTVGGDANQDQVER